MLLQCIPLYHFYTHATCHTVTYYPSRCPTHLRSGKTQQGHRSAFTRILVSTGLSCAKPLSCSGAMTSALHSAAMRSTTALLLFTAAVLLGAVAADPKPYWPRRFTVGFNETTKMVFSWHTDGTWYYDADAGVELVHRQNGRGDRYCKTIHPFTDTPCNHLVTGGKRYLIFPELGECCMCCTAEAGCGILSPDWLQDAQYEGTVQMAGTTAYKWSKKGLQPNYYYSTADSKQVPVELDQVPNDYQTFDRASFSTKAMDLSLFKVPSDCADRCPLTSICSILRSQQPMRQAFAPTR